MELIEAIARAIYDKAWEQCAPHPKMLWETMQPKVHETMFEQARAALQTIEEQGYVVTPAPPKRQPQAPHNQRDP